MLYLDANATEVLRPTARLAAGEAMEAANPSSIHAAGRAARKILEHARETVAAKFNVQTRNVIFTSGATEANALAIQGLGAGRPVLVGATEHDAVRAAAPDGVTIGVHRDGTADVSDLTRLLDSHPGALVCLMAANNETGVRHDIARAAAICAAHGARLHVDAAQAAPRMPEDWLAMGVTSFAISGHKAGGPAGAGALLVASPLADTLPALQKGGGQESGRRGGTPPLPAIAGMAAALGEETDWGRIAGQRDAIAAHARSIGALIAGEGAEVLPNTVCLIMPGLRAETQLIALDLAGIAVSAGAACSSGKVGASHVLTAMGFGPLAGHAIRVSLPWNAGDDVSERFNAAYAAMVGRALRREETAVTSPAHAV